MSAHSNISLLGSAQRASPIFPYPKSKAHPNPSPSHNPPFPLTSIKILPSNFKALTLLLLQSKAFLHSKSITWTSPAALSDVLSRELFRLQSWPPLQLQSPPSLFCKLQGSSTYLPRRFFFPGIESGSWLFREEASSSVKVFFSVGYSRWPVLKAMARACGNMLFSFRVPVATTATKGTPTTFGLIIKQRVKVFGFTWNELVYAILVAGLTYFIFKIWIIYPCWLMLSSFELLTRVTPPLMTVTITCISYLPVTFATNTLAIYIIQLFSICLFVFTCYSMKRKQKEIKLKLSRQWSPANVRCFLLINAHF